MLPIYNCIRPWRTSVVPQHIVRRFLESNCKQTTPLSSFSTIQLDTTQERYHSRLLMSATMKMNVWLSPPRRSWHHSSILNNQPHPPWQIPRTTVPSPNQVKPEAKPVEELVDEGSLLLLEQIYEANSVQAILDVYQQQKDNFTDVHSVRALWCLGQVCGRGRKRVTDDVDLPAEIHATKLIQMDGFRHLCSRVLQDSPHMNDESFITTLRSIQWLNIPDKSDLVQTFLEQCKHRLNTFNSIDFSHLVAILNRMPESNMLVQVLLDGAALKVPDLIDDINQMLTAVTFLRVLGRRLSFNNQRKLVNRLLAVAMAREDLNVENVIQGLRAVGGIKGNTKAYCELAVDFLTDKLDDIQRNDLVSIVIALDKNRYYDRDFFQVVGHRIVQMITYSSGSSGSWSLNQLAHLCRVYAKFDHFHRILLDTTAEFVVQTTQQRYSLLSLTNIIQPFAKFAYLPLEVPHFLDFVMNACDTVNLEKERLRTCVSMATNLMYCGRCPDKMIEFIQSHQVNLEDSIMLNNLRKMHQVMSVRGFTSHFPEAQTFIDSLPEDLGQKRLSPKVEGIYQKAKALTKKALTSLVGETCELVENVDAGCGYTIDFVFKQGEIKQAVILQDSRCYAANLPNHALVWNKLMEQHLQAKGYQVVWLQVEDIIHLEDTQECKAFICDRVGFNGS